MPYGDEGKGGKSRISYVDRVKMSTLFKGNKPNVAKKFTQHWKITSSTEYVPEAIYFTSLNKKGRMYMTINDFPKGKGNSVSYSYKTGTETVEVPGDAVAAADAGDQGGTSNNPGTANNDSTPIAEALDSTTIRLNLNQIEDGDKYQYDYIIMPAGSGTVSSADPQYVKTPVEGADSVVFDRLEPGTYYEIWKRDATGVASKIDDKVVSTPKEKWAAPVAAPTATAISTTSIKASRIAESENFIIEYSIDNGVNWVPPKENEDSVIFEELTPNTNYQVICRIAGNEQYDPSDASPAASVTTNKVVTRAVYKTVNGSDNPDWIYESQQLF